MAFSKATGRSCAPGGFRFLLGLPCGVETGVVKLFRPGVLGRSAKESFWLARVWRAGGGTGRTPSCLLAWDEGKRLVMKFDMLGGLLGRCVRRWVLLSAACVSVRGSGGVGGERPEKMDAPHSAPPRASRRGGEGVT